MVAYLGDVLHFCLKEPTNGETILQELQFGSQVGDKNKQGNNEILY